MRAVGDTGLPTVEVYHLCREQGGKRLATAVCCNGGLHGR